MVELGTSQKGSGRLSFGEIVGQEELKEALLAVVTSKGLDGLLVRGEKGTAKSTAVRALADLLPSQRVVEDCQYGCAPAGSPQCEECRERANPPVAERPVPLVTLPLGATRERVVGSLSVADALEGEYEFEPGVLARANRGILYVDEVNLLDDHLVDVILDAAASGVNRVERDGISISHPAEFTLVGTMNPEEGELRPQLRDRFALQATVTGCADVDDRVAIIEQALGEDKPSGGDSESAVRERIVRARELLADVQLAEEYAVDIATLCRDAGVDGHRGDIAIAHCARTFAALDGRTRVIESDVRQAVNLALPHRMAARPFEEGADPEEIADDVFDDAEDSNDGESEDADREGSADSEGASDDKGDTERGEQNRERAPDSGDSTGSETGRGDETDDVGDEARNERDETDGEGEGNTGGDSIERSDSGNDGGPAPQQEAGQTPEGGTAAPGEASEDAQQQGSNPDEEATPLLPGQQRRAAGIGESTGAEMPTPETEEPTDSATSGRGEAAPTVRGRGARVRTEVADGTENVDAAASVRAAARRGETAVQSRDLRQSVRTTDASALVVFAVDASASMRPAMRAAKGTVLELLKDAYQQRDEVAFVTFAGESADVLLPPTDSVSLAAKHLKDLPTGDRTPLPAGLTTAATVLERADPDTGLVVVVTDGKANVSENPVTATRQAADALAAQDASVMVVDAGTGQRTSLVDAITDRTDGTCLSLDRLSADRVDSAVADSQRSAGQAEWD